MLHRELPALVQACHLAHVPLGHQLAQGTGATQTGEPGQVGGRLGVTGPGKDAAVASAQRHHVTRPGEVAGPGTGVGEQPDGPCAVGGGDAGADPVGSVGRYPVGGAPLVLVDGAHRRQVEPVAVVAGQRDADEPGRVPDHERHQLGCRQLGGEDQIALVFAVLVVVDDDRLAGRYVGDGPLDAVQPACRPALGPHRCLLAGVGARHQGRLLWGMARLVVTTSSRVTGEVAWAGPCPPG